MNEKFTPAPWIYMDGDSFEKDTVITTEGRIDNGTIPICEMSTHFTGSIGGEQEANAALIAAAPEMYAMLKQLQLEGGLGIARHRQIDRVMAKARGEA